ncbi:hypothetical protein ACFLZG_06370 [Thermodesulfobacteriota bacterium]
MEDGYSGHTYSSKDLDKAYAMGLETAIVLLEKSIGLSPTEQRQLIETIKEKILKKKVSAIMNQK